MMPMYSIASAIALLAQQAQQGSWLVPIMAGFAAVMIWHLVVTLPGKREQENFQRKLDSIEKLDEILTVGGIVGTVMAIDKNENRLVLRTDEKSNSRITIDRRFVREILQKKGQRPEGSA
jgi:preprotein translocase subunit YajC